MEQAVCHAHRDKDFCLMLGENMYTAMGLCVLKIHKQKGLPAPKVLEEEKTNKC